MGFHPGELIEPHRHHSDIYSRSLELDDCVTYEISVL